MDQCLPALTKQKCTFTGPLPTSAQRQQHMQHSPSTSSRFDRIDPSRDVATTSYNPFCRAAIDKIISTTLPKVAFNRPPTVSPNRTARSSVTSPSSSARGTSARKFCRGQTSHLLQSCTTCFHCNLMCSVALRHSNLDYNTMPYITAGSLPIPTTH